MLVLCLLLFLVNWVWLYFWYSRKRLRYLAAKIPPVDGHLPLVGIAHKLVGDTESIMSALQDFSYSSMKHDGLVRFWLGHILYFILINPVDMEHILKTCLEKDDLHRFFRKLIGYGGIFAPVPIWRRRRKVLVPIFSPRILETFVEVFSEQSQKLTKNLSNKVGTGKICMWPLLSAYTLDSVCATTMGVKINALNNGDSPFVNAMCRLLNLMCQRIFYLWLQPDWLHRLSPRYKEHQRCIGLMHGFTDQVISNKREEIKKGKACTTKFDYEYDLDTYKRTTFLDLLINFSGGENGYTNVELREEILTLTIAGTDTSAVGIGCTLQLLAKYPAIQEQVYQELQEVFGDSDRLLVKEDLKNLKYLACVIKESIRLYPPVPFIIRKVLEDTKLPSGRILPAGSGVVCSIWGIHRDPKYWGADAEVFDPDRFLPERFNLKNTCSYMPFSSGPRNCVGYKYAIMSMKTVLSTILRQYKIVEDRENGPVPHIRVKLDIMMKAVDGYQIAFEKREKTLATRPQ